MVLSEPQDFYADPAIYDILHSPGTAGEVDALLRLTRRFVGKGARRFLEPACGTGRYLRVLAGRGHRVVGFDREPAMVEYARGRLRRFGARARVILADMESFVAADPASARPRGGPARTGGAGRAPTLPPASIDVAFTPINSIRHLQTDRAMLAHFEQVARVLRPGGIYVVGVSITAYGVEAPSEDVWKGARGPCRVSQLVQYLPAPGGRGPGARDETVISHMTIRTPRRARHIDSTYTLRAYESRQWELLVARSALEIVAVVDEEGREMSLAPPGYAIFVLRPGRAIPA